MKKREKREKKTEAPKLSPMGKPKAPCQLVGIDGNVFSIIGHVKKALKKAGYTSDEQGRYVTDMMLCASYDEVLAKTMSDWIEPL